LPRALAALALFATVPAYAASSCEDLANLTLPEVTSISATLVTNGTITLPRAYPVSGLPPLCRVSLVIAPQINIEVWLPLTWNGRLQTIGGGGYDGNFQSPTIALPGGRSGFLNAVLNGYATAGTDTGHSADSIVDGSFALNADGTLNWQLITDNAYRSWHEVALKAKGEAIL
jgi:hypothetical protein